MFFKLFFCYLSEYCTSESYHYFLHEILMYLLIYCHLLSSFDRWIAELFGCKTNHEMTVAGTFHKLFDVLPCSGKTFYIRHLKTSKLIAAPTIISP